MMKDIGQVEYFKCSNCGFTISKTHCEIAEERWEKLNYEFHHYLENNKVPFNQPPYLQQAAMLKILSTHEIIDINNSVDYAGGYGTLSSILNKYFNIKLSVYDPYVNKQERDIYIPKEKLSKYKTVINSALFEHLRTRSSFNDINNCVRDDGCMIIHTHISENNPKDSNWFYLEPPVHCAFHTNKSIKILMDQWGYVSSIYCLQARSWVLFKKDSDEIKYQVAQINRDFQTEYLIYKKGFVDYWKGY